MAKSKCGAFTVGRGWRRTIGVKVADGRLVPCRFWLGMDKPLAMATALRIEAVWVGLNRPYWNAEALAIAESIRVGAKAARPPESTPAALPPLLQPPPCPTAAVLTFSGLIDRFCTAYKADPRRSMASKHATASRAATLKRSPIANLPIGEIGAEQITALVSHWLQRPIAPKTQQPISETSARLVVKTARAVFDYADSIGIWSAPRRFDRLFKLPRRTNPIEIETYTIKELSRLYKAADKKMRLLMLLSLNCGFCSSEIATLQQSEIDLKTKMIERRRQKTAVAMRWNLWGETATALSDGMASKGTLAIQTPSGKPLTYYSDGATRVDVIALQWRRLKLKAKVPHGTFKTLRKTGATLMRAIGGIEVSELYLAHAEQSMARFYSVPSYERMGEALQSLRLQLLPMMRS